MNITFIQLVVLGAFAASANVLGGLVLFPPGGVTLYVAAGDLIPEVNHHGGKRPPVSLSVFAGVALFFLIHYTLHTVLEK